MSTLVICHPTEVLVTFLLLIEHQGQNNLQKSLSELTVLESYGGEA